jgi:hypothetical protein
MKMIAQAVQASDKPVIIISHSKGGLDLLDMLAVRPDLQGKLAGWIPIQTPFHGTPVADYVSGTKLVDRLARYLMGKFTGSKYSMRELGTKARADYQHSFKARVAEIARTLPILSVASWKDKMIGPEFPGVELARRAMLKLGLKNDGIVPFLSAIYPAAPYIALADLDHKTTIMSSHFKPFDRERFTKALLVMLLQLMP